jgi:TolB-like protein/Tfp pilus assembly protein PilF
MGLDFSAGTKLGRYEIRSQLGAGGMGEVYLAQDPKLDRKVALKILPAEVSADRGRMSRFVQEAKAASALNHPNILTIYEIDQANSVQFIATEFIDGETLRQRMKSAPLKLGDVLDVTAQIASALSAAHAAGIVHRDIKPENIMLRRDGIAKVLDFGLAKLTERPLPDSVDTEAPTSFKTDPGTVVGTAVYMSPEQARGMAVDARTDIWSLGVLLYEMVAGCLPFEGLTTSEILASILNEKESLPLARFAREVPAELERIVTKALRKDREQRYQVIKDMLLDLRSLKHRLEFEAELERSAPPAVRGEATAGSEQAAVETKAAQAARSTFTTQFLSDAIKLHKRGAMVAAVAVIVGIITIAYFYSTRSSKTAIDSMAILPFVNVSHDPNTEYLSDGITESLINNLARLPNLRMIARSSVFRYKGKETDPQTVGNALGVQTVLTGRVVQLGDNLSISAELVDVRNNSHLWGERYDRKLADILAVQDEIARNISEKLRFKLTGDEQQRLAKRYTENTEAYQLYLKGRYFSDKLTREGINQALEHYKQAIGLDPNYALAYAGLADAYYGLSNIYMPPREVMPSAGAAAKKALELDDNLAEAHASLGTVRMYFDWNWLEAEKEFQRAIALNPNFALVHLRYGLYLNAAGRFDEALRKLKQAQQLDPLSLEINAFLGLHFLTARQYDQAIEQSRKAIAMDQNYWVAHDFLASAYELKGELSAAIAEWEKARELDDNPTVLAKLGHGYAVAGKKGEALKILSELKKMSAQRYVSPYFVAMTYAALGENDQAFTWLEKTYDDRNEMLIWLKVDPIFDSLHSDPRFADLVRRVGL